MNADLWFNILLKSEIEDLPKFRFINRDCNKVLNDSYYWRSRFLIEKLPLVSMSHTDFIGWFNEYVHVRRTVDITAHVMNKEDGYWNFDLSDLHDISLLFVDGVDRHLLSRVFMRSKGVWGSYKNHITLRLAFYGGTIVEMTYRDELMITRERLTSWPTVISYTAKLTQSATKQILFNLCYRRTTDRYGCTELGIN